MSRKHQYFGGMIGDVNIANLRTSGVFNLGGLSGDKLAPSPPQSLTYVYFLDGSVSGSTATSILGGSNATLGSGVSQVSGVGPKGNDGFWFTGGSTATYIKNTAITSMYGGLPYTFTAMIKANLGGSNSFALLSKNSFYASGTSDFPFSIQITPAGLIACSLDSSDNDFASDYTLTSTGSVSNNTWTHVAVVADTSSVKIYIDGTLDASGTHSVTLSSTSHAWTIGNHSAGSQTNLSAFNGYMTDIMFIDDALAAGDIADLYAAAAPNQDVLRPTRRWGGITGRSLVTGSNVQATGVLSLPELLQEKYYTLTAPNGLTAATAGDSAAQILADYPSSPDGIYYIKDGAGTKQVYCDMTNGGWMLYSSFASTNTLDATNYPAWNGNRITNGTLGTYGYAAIGAGYSSYADGASSTFAGGYTHINEFFGCFWYSSSGRQDGGVGATTWKGPSNVSELRIRWGQGAGGAFTGGTVYLDINGFEVTSMSSVSPLVSTYSFNPASASHYFGVREAGIAGISYVYMR